MEKEYLEFLVQLQSFSAAASAINTTALHAAGLMSDGDLTVIHGILQQAKDQAEVAGSEGGVAMCGHLLELLPAKP